MDDYWDKKVEEVVRISEESGYKDLDKEFWMNQPAVLTSLVTDIYKLKDLRKKEQLKSDVDSNSLP